jgi:hypothetical protein
LKRNQISQQLVLFVEVRDCGRQNVIGQMIDELMARIEPFSARRAPWHNDAAATLWFIDERPHGAEAPAATHGAMQACPFQNSRGFYFGRGRRGRDMIDSGAMPSNRMKASHSEQDYAVGESR